jgi:hypothetical protein
VPERNVSNLKTNNPSETDMCSGGGSSKQPDPPKIRDPQVLRNPFLDQGIAGSAGGILRSGRANLRIGLGSGRSGRTSATGAVGGVADPNQIAAGGSQGTGEFKHLTFGASDRQANIAKQDYARSQTKAAKRQAKRDKAAANRVKQRKLEESRGGSR